MREILSEVSEMGSQHYFQMHSGHECEGWIVSVEDDHILFVDCDPQAGKDETKVRFAAIDIGSLAYHDDDQKCWINVRWDDALKQWTRTVIAQDAPPPEPVEPVRTSFWDKFKRGKPNNNPTAESQLASPFSKPTGSR